MIKIAIGKCSTCPDLQESDNNVVDFKQGPMIVLKKNIHEASQLISKLYDYFKGRRPLDLAINIYNWRPPFTTIFFKLEEKEKITNQDVQSLEKSIQKLIAIIDAHEILKNSDLNALKAKLEIIRKYSKHLKPEEPLEEALVDDKTKEESRKYFETIINDEYLSFKTKLQWAQEMVQTGVISKEEAGRLINQQREKGK